MVAMVRPIQCYLISEPVLRGNIVSETPIQRLSCQMKNTMLVQVSYLVLFSFEETDTAYFLETRNTLLVVVAQT